MRASPGWGPTPSAAPGTGPLWRERSTVTRGLRCSFPTCPCLTQRHSPLGAESTKRRVHSGFIFEQMRVTTPASLFKPEEEAEFKGAGAVFLPCDLSGYLHMGGTSYKKQKAVNRGPVYGTPPVKGVLTVPSENSAPSWGPPPPTRRMLRNEIMKEGWSGKRLFQGTWQIVEDTLIP